MSRLDSFIRRLEAQRACLGAAATATAGMAGIVLELGLGNGRTYDHLRTICPERDIFVFDRQITVHPDCLPPPEQVFLGDLAATLPQAKTRLGEGSAALVHADLGSGDARASQDLAQCIAPDIAQLMAPGAIIVSDQPILLPALSALPLPEGVPEGRYFMAAKRV